MRFTMSGQLRDDPGGRLRAVTWEDGRLSGDDAAVIDLMLKADWWATEEIGPPCGPYTAAPHLAHPLAVMELARSLFTFETFDAAGDVPMVPSYRDAAGRTVIH